VELWVPPLRERGDDVALIAHVLLSRAAARMGKRLQGFTDAALLSLRRYRWPGNVRELQNEVERAAIAAEGPLVDVGDLSPDLAVALPRAPGPSSTLAERFAALESTERELVVQALETARGNVSEAARLLGITRIMMKRRVDRFGLRDERDDGG
jgi:Nif-specific regulatory protein